MCLENNRSMLLEGWTLELQCIYIFFLILFFYSFRLAPFRIFLFFLNSYSILNQVQDQNLFIRNPLLYNNAQVDEMRHSTRFIFIVLLGNKSEIWNPRRKTDTDKNACVFLNSCAKLFIYLFSYLTFPIPSRSDKSLNLNSNKPQRYEILFVDFFLFCNKTEKKHLNKITQFCQEVSIRLGMTVYW